MRFHGIRHLAVAGMLCAAQANSAARAAEPDAKREAARPRVVVLGDSLATSAGRDSYPSVLQRRIDERGYRYQVVNAGRGGDTTAGGLRRIDEALEGEVAVVIVELGGNDGLRGVPVRDIKRNLVEIVKRAKAKSAAVLLAQMETPPSRGFDYTVAFHNMYGEVAREQGVALIPFILADVVGDSSYTRDGIHPNKAGAARIAETVWRSLEPVLGR
jgi:acyl-CoA thioesterase-1